MQRSIGSIMACSTCRHGRKKAFYVFTGHISQFKISPSAYKEAETELRKYLYSVYEKYLADGSLLMMYLRRLKNGKVNKMILKLFKDNIASQVEALNIKSQIPAMAKQLAAELKTMNPVFRNSCNRNWCDFCNLKTNIV